MLDRGLADQAAHRVGDLPDRDAGAAFEGQRPVRRGRGECPHVRVGEVLNIDVVALLVPGAGDRDRLAVQRQLHELGDDQRVPHPGPVRDAVPQHGELLAVHLPVAVHEHLGGQLRGYVDVPGPGQVDERVLVPLAVARGRAVHPDGAGQDDPPAALAAGGGEDPGGALDVQPDGADRVRVDVVDVGHRGQVEDGLAVRQRGVHRVVVEQVGAAMVGCRVEPPGGRVDHAHVMPGSQQMIYHV